ncbi:MAG: 3-hydroxyacyl-CoA dehydrogenase family protein [Deltaproteobacteria bacterium]
MEVKKVLVVGSGLMGSGIAQVCAQAAIGVFLNDASEDALNKAIKNIEWSVGKFIEKGKLTEEKKTILGRITLIRDLEKGKDVDLAIEAVFEQLELKQQIFEKLDQLCAAHTLLASNTSAIPISDLAAVTLRADKVLGLHFFSPVPMMPVAEVIKGISTTDETARAGGDFVNKIGKEAIMVNRDVPGFAINRINFPSTIEAMNLVEQGVVSIEDVDKGLRLGLGRKMGIFETGDMVGLDVTYGALMAMYRETGDSRWYPPLLLRRRVKAGHLGRKTGRGWYQYDKDGNKVKD